MSFSSIECGPLHVEAWARKEPRLVQLCSENDSLRVLRDVKSGQALLGIQSKQSLAWVQKFVRDAVSGIPVLTARASPLRRRSRWTIFDHKGRIAFEVTIERVLERRKAHDSGPAVYVLRIYEPHFERPRIIASPEGGRLVVRTWDGKRSLVAGDALCEAAYDGSLSPSGGSSSSSGPRSGASSGASGSGSGAESPRSPLDLPQELAAAWEAAKAAINTPVNAAVAPRAEVPLMACLMAIYQHIVDEDAELALKKLEKALAKEGKRQQKMGAAASRQASKSAAAEAAAQAAAIDVAAAAAAVEAAAAEAAAAEAAAVQGAEGEASLRQRWAQGDGEGDIEAAASDEEATP